MSTANMNTIREATKTGVSSTYGRTARKAVAALLASTARVLKMTAFCVAVAGVPAACSAITGHKPVNCEVDFCDL